MVQYSSNKYSVKTKKVKYKISVTPGKNICDNPYSGDYVKKFKITASIDDKSVGRLNGYIFDVSEMLFDEELELFDDTSNTERLFSCMYHGTPLNADRRSIEKGFRPEFMSFLNDHYDFMLKNPNEEVLDDEEDEFVWAEHFAMKIGFVESIVVDDEKRGLGIGTEMMRMLRRFRNTVDIMVLQSFPDSLQNDLGMIGMTYEEQNSFMKTPFFKSKAEDAQNRIDQFYTRLGFIPCKVDQVQLMVTDSLGLKELDKDNIKAKYPVMDGPDFP